jgi:beta-glucosidase-like glycosyl hydrolase
MGDFLSAASYPLLVCDNMENGFKDPKAVSLPCQMAIGAINSEDAAYQFGRLTAIDAKAVGFNMVFGPIVDIALNAGSACVGPRSFGGDKELVARMAAAAIRGYQDQGMVVTAKHFPGFGESHVDSHIGMVYLSGDEKLLRERELYPYRYAMEQADLSGVMVGHIMVPRVDPDYPASISPKLIGLLRDIGFSGLVMTDSLAMVGMTNRFGLKECHGLAMAAGNDMVMTSYRLDARTAYGYMLEAYKKGQVTGEQIHAVASRVLAAQARTLKKAYQGKATDKYKTTGISLSERSVTVIGDTSGSIDPQGKHLFIIQVPNRYTNLNPATQGRDVTAEERGQIHDLIAAYFPRSQIVKTNDFPSNLQIEHALARSMEFDSVVMVVHSVTGAYVGSSDLTRRTLALMEGLAHKLSAVVLFGNAYAAREFPRVPCLVLGYEGGACEEAAFKVLAGKNQPEGTVPVSLTPGD